MTTVTDDSQVFPRMIQDHASFAEKLVNRLLQLSWINDAHKFAAENLNRLKQHLGENHKETLKLEGSKAVAESWKGNHLAAIDILKQLHAKMICMFGEEDEDTLHVAHNLAVNIGLIGENHNAK